MIDGAYSRFKRTRVGCAIKSLILPARNQILHVERWLRQRMGLFEGEKKIVADCQRFWNAEENGDLGGLSHWRGNFRDEDGWLALGREHLRWFQQMSSALEQTRPIERILEWGCGGGAIAVHFGRDCKEYFGVDVSQSSLDECQRQMEWAGLGNFVPVRIDAARPGDALGSIPHPCDLFIGLFVFEVFPTPEYGLRVLKIAYDLLNPGALAFLQIRYITDSWETKPSRWGYAKHICSMTAYRIDEFWEEAQKIGFSPRLIKLVPKSALNRGERYAYYLLQK